MKLIHHTATVAMLCASIGLLSYSVSAKEGKVESKPVAKKAKLFCPVAGVHPRKKGVDKCPNGYCARRVNAKISAPHNGGTVNFCCGGCPKVFKKNPKPFIATANLQLAASGQAKQKGCPFSGGKLGTDKVDVAGVSVGTCCGNCAKKLAGLKGLDQVNAAFNAKAFKKGFVVKAAKSKTK